MDFKGKNVTILSNNHGATPWICKQLKEQGAHISKDISENTDVLLTPMLNKIEQRLFSDSIQEIISYPAFIKYFIDKDFKPAWFASGTCKPSVFDSILIPEYTRSLAHMLDPHEMSYDDIKEIADFWGIPVCTDSNKGTVLIVLPDNCHQYNIDFIRHAFEMRLDKNNNAFITMSQLKMSFREWKITHPHYKKPTKQNFQRQNLFFSNLWQICKEASHKPYRDFSHGIWRDYVALDTEYHNVRDGIPYPAVIEIGAVRVVSGRIVDTFHCFVKHDFLDFSKLHKYREINPSEQLVLELPDAIQQTIQFVGDSPIIGHSINTDILVLSFNGNHVFKNPTLDTHYLLATEYPFHVPVFSLPKLAEYFGLHKNSHFALDDAITTQQLYEHIVSVCTQK